MKLNRVLLLLIVAIFAASCGSRKKVDTRKDDVVKSDRREENKNSPAEIVDDVREEMPRNSYHYRIEDYIRDYSDIAQEEMKLYKIPASITLAQGILESGAGNGQLTRQANNHFGIKCHDWNGEKVYHDDDRKGECFRKYKHAKYSYRDHSLFLSGRGRYSELFELDANDYEGWAKGLRKAGYATDRRYPDKLIDLIERYELYKFDENISGKSTRSYAAQPKTTSESHVVQKGDTLYSISKKYDTTVEDIKRRNGLNGNNISIGQILNVK